MLPMDQVIGPESQIETLKKIVRDQRGHPRSLTPIDGLQSFEKKSMMIDYILFRLFVGSRR